MKINELDNLVDELKKYSKNIKMIQSKADSLIGEKKQLLEHKEQLISKIQEDFKMSLNDLEPMIETWTSELQKGIDEIKNILNI